MVFSNYSCSFDGTNEYVTMGNVLGFEYNQVFSLSVWFRTTTTSGYLVSKKSNLAGLFAGYGLQVNGSGGLRFFLTNDGSVAGTSEIVVDTTATYADDQWHHVVVTWDGNVTPGAGGVLIYVDGALATTSTVYNTLGTNSILTGADFNLAGRTNGDEPFTGYLDEVAVYDKVLSLSEVQWVFNANIYGKGWPRDLSDVGAPSNLVSWWRMGDGDTYPTLIDVSANVYDGTMVNMEAGDIALGAPLSGSGALTPGEGFDVLPFGASFYLSPLVPGISWDVVASPPSVTYYTLGATDTGAGRRYWQSTTKDFASAPTPVGSWDITSLVLLNTQTV